MRIADLHCDTLGEMYDRTLSFADKSLDISAFAVEGYDKYLQVSAVWSPKELSNDQCWDRFLAVCDMAGKTEFPVNFSRVLAVEDVRLIGGDLSKLDIMRSMGVRFATLTWAGESQIGGAHDTDGGLTAFGEKVVERCFEIGIIPDVSHASDAVFYDVVDISSRLNKPFVATHSNCRDVYYHRRNITDDMYLTVARSGGITGVSLEPTHLGDRAGVVDAVRHILHYFDLSEDHVCLGCDFDGRTSRTKDLESAVQLSDLGRALVAAGLIEDDVDRIFYRNAERFLKENNII
ncbi:MAG: membrane dipeptidase [Clostridia bacterium]|nr:membrane dipeptidase [Clostridia bacterium]